jgi:hypothetical protein
MRHNCSNSTDYQPIQKQKKKHYTGIITKTKNKTAQQTKRNNNSKA